MANKIVVGLGFGDEGKGVTTSYLSGLNPNSIVVRYNGGQQAGHTVHYRGRVHVFSQFGAGTLQGLPTYLSQYCTMYPPALIEEAKLLEDVREHPLYIHPETMITLPIDIEFNRVTEDSLGKDRHGSVGMGFGATIQRNEAHFNLYAKDLLFPRILRAKLENIYKHYYKTPPGDDIEYFLDCVEKVESLGICICDHETIYHSFLDIIYEGAQGILLDQHHGFFPNVTRSNTTCRNVVEMLPNGREEDNTEVFYVTRCYQTRHGAGYMSYEDHPRPVLVNNHMETNVSHAYQGDFRVTELDIESLIYALESDKIHTKYWRKSLVITCLDQRDFDPKRLVSYLESKIGYVFNNVYLSYDPDSISMIKMAR